LGRVARPAGNGRAKNAFCELARCRRRRLGASERPRFHVGGASPNPGHELGAGRAARRSSGPGESRRHGTRPRAGPIENRLGEWCRHELWGGLSCKNFKWNLKASENMSGEWDATADRLLDRRGWSTGPGLATSGAELLRAAGPHPLDTLRGAISACSNRGLLRGVAVIRSDQAWSACRSAEMVRALGPRFDLLCYAGADRRRWPTGTRMSQPAGWARFRIRHSSVR